MKDPRPRTRIIITFLLVFLLSGFGKAQFMIEPESVVQAEGLEGVFECLVPGALAPNSWIVNGIDFLSAKFPEEIRGTGGSSGNPSVLTIPASLQFNSSVVQCVAFLMSGREFSRNATLTVEQIAIDVVTANNNFLISVTNNFTTNLTYRLNVTLGNTIVASVLNKSQQFIFEHPVCDMFSFTVTPIAMEMKGRPSEPVTGFFTINDGIVTSQVCQGDDIAKKIVTLSIVVPNCTNFTSYFVKPENEKSELFINGTIESNKLINFTFPADIKVNITLTLTSMFGVHLTHRNILIDTTDVQDLKVTQCPDGGGIDVEPIYVKGSRAPGALVCIVPVNNNVPKFDDMRLVAIPENYDNNCTIPELTGGLYNVVAFDLEDNSLPKKPIAVASDSDEMSVAFSKGTPSPLPQIQNNQNISMPVLSDNDVLAFCPRSLNCLVLVQILRDPNRLHVGFSDSVSNSVNVSLDTIREDGYVVVYIWESTQTIFDGKVSLIAALSSLNTATTLPPDQPTLPSFDSGSPQESLSIALIAGIIAGLIFFAFVLCLVALAFLCLVNKSKRKSKVLKTSYTSIMGYSRTRFTSGSSQEMLLIEPRFIKGTVSEYKDYK